MLLCHTWIEKSETYRRNIGLEPSGARRGAAAGGFQKMAENIADISVFIGIFTDFSGNFLIFPTSPARAQDTKSVQFFF